MSYKSQKRKTAIVIIILIISVLIAFTLCIFLFISYIKEKNKTVKALNKIEFLEEKNEKLYTQKLQASLDSLILLLLMINNPIILPFPPDS